MIRLVICHDEAPSMAAASRSSGGMPLQAGQQQDDPEADELPGDHEEQRVEHQRRAGQPEVDQGGQADRLEQGIRGPAVR